MQSKIPNRSEHVFCLYTGLLDLASVQEAVKIMKAHLVKNHGFTSRPDAMEEVALIKEVGKESIAARKRKALVYSNDKRFVNACLGFNFDGTPLRRVKESSLTPSSSGDLSSHSPSSMSTSSLTHSTDSPMSKSPIPEFVPASGRLWSDSVDEDEDIFADPPKFDSEPVKPASPQIISMTPAAPKPMIVEYENLPSMVEPVIIKYSPDVINYIKTIGRGEDSYVEVKPSEVLEFKIEEGKHSPDTLATFVLPPEVDENDLHLPLSRYITHPGKTGKIRVRVDPKTARVTYLARATGKLKPGEEMRTILYPFIYTKYYMDKGVEKRTLIIKFDPETRDARDALLMCRQLPIIKNGKTYDVVLVNCFLSWC